MTPLLSNQNSGEQTDVFIDYLDNIITTVDMEEIEVALKEANLLISYSAHPPRLTAGIEDFFSNFSIILSPDIVQMISSGIVTNIISATLIKLCTITYNKIKGKKIKKIQSGGVIQDESIKAHFIIGKAHIILPTNIDNDKFKYFIDKVFDSINPEIINNECYTEYNEKTGQIIFYSKEQIIKNSYDEWLKAQVKKPEI